MEILAPDLTFSPVGHCIYCGKNEGQMTDEHVIPFGLGGTLVLPKSSCPACSAKTAALEQTIQRMLLGPFRIRLGLPTRRKKERPTKLDFFVMRRGQVSKKLLPVSEFPLVYHTAKLPPPRILSALPVADRLDYEMVAIMDAEVMAKHAGKAGQGFSPGQFEPLVFLRFLAKIEHSYAIGRLGTHHFRPVLPDIILGNPEVLVSSLFQLIGGGPEIKPNPNSDPELRTLHLLSTRSDNRTGPRYVIASVQLFSFLNAPTYDVVVGEYQGP
jgi:hypothetical protein